MAITVTAPDETETVHRNVLMYDIREALGISTIGTAATISNTLTRRTVGSLEMLTHEELTLLLAVSQKARANSMLERVADRGGNYAPATKPFAGEECALVRDLVYKNKLSGLFLIAPAVDLIPAGMNLGWALQIIDQIVTEMFDLSTAERVASHLLVAKATIRYYQYDPQMMLLVNTHPDKAETIISLSKGTERVPTNREVITHHGISPVMYDGVL